MCLLFFGHLCNLNKFGTYNVYSFFDKFIKTNSVVDHGISRMVILVQSYHVKHAYAFFQRYRHAKQDAI